MDLLQELKSLTAALAAGEIDYARCGGVALAIHGVPRATQDIDLLLRPEALARLRDAIRACGFTFESLPMDFASGITMQRFTKLADGQPLMLDVLLAGAGDHDHGRGPHRPAHQIGRAARQAVMGIHAVNDYHS